MSLEVAMADPGAPIDFSEFSAEVARQAGVSEGELSPRSAGQPPDELAVKAQQQELPHMPDRHVETVDEALQALYSSYEQVIDALEVFPGMHDIGGRLTFTDVIGEPQPVPTWDTIEGRFDHQKNLLMRKVNQGFTRLVLVPFGGSTRALVKGFTEECRVLGEAGALRCADGRQYLSCDIDDELSFLARSVEGGMVYMLDAESPSQELKTKGAILRMQGLEGWKIYLAQNPHVDIAQAPPPLEYGLSPHAVRGKLTPGSDHEGEQLLTIETHAMLSYLQLCDDPSGLELRQPVVAGGSQDPESRKVPVVTIDTDASNILFYRIGKIAYEGEIPHPEVRYPTVVPLPLRWGA